MKLLGVVITVVGAVGVFTALTGTTASCIAALFAPTNNLTDQKGSDTKSITDKLTSPSFLAGVASPAVGLAQTIEKFLP